MGRVVLGTGVAGGMLAAALVGIFVIPALYVAFQWLRERGHKLLGISRHPAEAHGASTEAGATEGKAETPASHG